MVGLDSTVSLVRVQIDPPRVRLINFISRSRIIKIVYENDNTNERSLAEESNERLAAPAHEYTRHFK